MTSSNNPVVRWFGTSFNKLDPLLQKLHLSGGELTGTIELGFGNGLAGLLGKRLAKKMQLPLAGTHQLMVSISHSEHGLHWHRQFNNSNLVSSLFVPVTLTLTVDIEDGGWTWRVLSVSLFGMPIPTWLMPTSHAYKRIEHGRYQFYVGFRYPLLGNLISYQGVLDASNKR
jgi:hypothetical protein